MKKTNKKYTYTARFVAAMKHNPEFKGLKTAKEIFAQVRKLRKEGRHPLSDNEYALWILATRGMNEYKKYLDMFKFRIKITQETAKIKIAHLHKLIKTFNKTLEEVR